MISQIKEKIKYHMANDNTGHSFDHVSRVCELALKLLQNAKADKEVVVLAALLHDADDYKLFGEEAAENLSNAKRIMDECKVDKHIQERVCDVIANMGYSKSLMGIRPTTTEGKIVSDADMLDAIGINGIIRTLEYAFARCQKYGAPIFEKDIWPELNMSAEEYRKPNRRSDNCINHFFEKTLRLGKMMMTESGEKEAKIRLKRMVDFLEGFFDENDAPEWKIYMNDYLKKEDIL